ncbi:N-formylglutamate amidohydrolase [Shewanella halifaxensis]|uniref:N-formylglutamate amidohydrolase n=1 Tax=Shewanella halifaxensis TaxID=271098 RepID=UPI001F432CB0|nr:N-formylglutamate amidohydrolase [Shewanella halifaxensis]
MLKLSEKECIALINKGECFHAEVEAGAFTVKIDEYSPFVCTAIHNGHRLREDLQNNCRLTDEERRFAEAPFTADMLSSFPIVLTGNDSRYEYDLNRPKSHSTHYKTAWKKPLTAKQRNESHAKHESFYNVLSALVARLEKQFKKTASYLMYIRLTISKLRPTHQPLISVPARLILNVGEQLVRTLKSSLIKLSYQTLLCVLHVMKFFKAGVT